MSNTDDTGAEAGKGESTEATSASGERMVPLSALLAERGEKQSVKTEVENLRKEIENLKKKPAKDFTRSELQQAVDDGRMSQIDADRIIEQQTERKIEERVSQKVTSHIEEGNLKQRLQAELSKYTAAFPDINVEGTETRELLRREYARQLQLGKPDNLRTELDALTAVFGPPDSLRKGREKDLQTHQDGDSDGGDGKSKDTGTPKLPAHVKAHYDKLIGMGMYSGWNDPSLKKELETHKRPGW